MAELPRKSAVRFIVILGIVSLFADITYEGARGIIGPFFVTLGASAALVGTVAGAGELVGYTLRLLSGYLADRTHRYWTITILGYTINQLAVPLLAFAHHWELAALLVIAERTGKSIRTPARDVMLSNATQAVGRGWGFGLHAALDQTGACLGPLIVAATLALSGSYVEAFALLTIPAALSLATLIAARFTYPNPQLLEKPGRRRTMRLPGLFWLYVTAAGLLATGYADFALIAYHFEKASVVPQSWIPVSYSLAMGVEAIAALTFGRLFDRLGILVLPCAILISALALPLVFLGGLGLALAGMVCWGAGVGAQDATLRAGIAGMVSMDKRGSAYGIFNAGFGILWFAGSAAMGALYDRSRLALVVFGVVAQLLAAALFMLFAKRHGRE